MVNLIQIALNRRLIGQNAIFFQSNNRRHLSISLNHLQLPLSMFYSSQNMSFISLVGLFLSIFQLLLILIEVQFTCNIVVISAVQKSNSVIPICIHFKNIFFIMTSQETEYRSLCYTAGPCCSLIQYVKQLTSANFSLPLHPTLGNHMSLFRP